MVAMDIAIAPVFDSRHPFAGWNITVDECFSEIIFALINFEPVNFPSKVFVVGLHSGKIIIAIEFLHDVCIVH